MIPSPSRIEAQNPPVGRFVEAQGLRVHYVEMGPPDGVPVVLVHGATGNLNDMTFDLAPRLAGAGLRAIAFDRPGLGWSERPAREGWRPAVQTAVLREAAARLGVARPVVLGHSWGGAVATAWALQDPGIRGAVVISGATMPWSDGDDWLTGLKTSKAAAWVGAGVFRLMAERDGGASAAARIFRPQQPPEGYLDHLQPELVLRPETFRNNTEDIERLDGALAVQSRAYPDLVPPLEILHGLADEIVSAQIHSVALAELAPRSELTLLTGVGHMPHHDDPERVCRSVERLAEN
ncbi:alpha/beta fold hydrolase [Albimonas pacifica]|uniref:Pimeloyl-ACP methyl ester carboxylesterase n=1 Tax=Albimonas pacifica TaxID=1114924 RepID=A0A1I3K3W4_9RHOB|nr:alpha/beta hydrolase [Albimonas pacifica]SFI67094.1 Pimeloyl-ACP methyl ester carboxylesterase [Albimonas pacifica]